MTTSAGLSVLDLFTIGIGPSSSHTVGPMRAARIFAGSLAGTGLLERTVRVEAHLYGSLALTGKGHGTDIAILHGLEGESPESIDVDAAPGRIAAIRRSSVLRLHGSREIGFAEKTDLLFHRRESLPRHPNGMRFSAFDAGRQPLLEKVFYSTGGGFLMEDPSGKTGESGTPEPDPDTPENPVSGSPAPDPEVPYPFRHGADLLRHARDTGLSISSLMLANEASLRPEAETRAALLRVWQAMETCVRRGCGAQGLLPGPLKVERRAPRVFAELSASPAGGLRDPLTVLDWVSLWAMAVNEENAAGGRVVTAPTNGAAGIIPAVLHYFRSLSGTADEDRIVRFLLTAGAIGMLYKFNASISGAEVGCQGEVGVACSMAAAALCEVMGGSVAQVENAAEIGMEHNLGLTCDPIGGLVQVPCIERNAMGAVKAINAARLALRGDGTHRVPLDKVIATMRQTGADMSTKYKETSRGGLAVNVTAC